VFLTEHAEMRMLERNITLRQVFNVLERGGLVDGVEWCNKIEPGWKCKIKAISAGEVISVVAKLVDRTPRQLVLVITTFSTK